MRFQVFCPQNGTAVLKGLILQRNVNPDAPRIFSLYFLRHLGSSIICRHILHHRAFPSFSFPSRSRAIRLTMTMVIDSDVLTHHFPEILPGWRL